MISTVQELARSLPNVSRLESCADPMETPEHYDQLALLMACLKWLFEGCDDLFLGANLTVYFSEEQIKTRDFRGPDLFLVKDVEPRGRSSWVVWHEDGRYPDFILELLSDTTQQVDRGVKKELYQNQFRTPEYFWFSPQTMELAGFRLMAGRYEPIQPDDRRWLWSEVLELYLGVWEGQLRFFFEEGSLVLTPEETAKQERERANREQHEKELERERAERAEAQNDRSQAEIDRLREMLKELGRDPDSL